MEAKRNRHTKGIARRRTHRISESLRRQIEIKLNKRKQCNKKRRYETEEQAQAECAKIRVGVVLLFTPLEPYYCYRHQSWHIGHDWLTYNKTKEWGNEIK